MEARLTAMGRQVVVILTLLTGAFPAFAADVQFGDLRIEGKRIAFVCDGSRWTKNKADELVEELKRATDAMSKDQHVAVTFFADQSTRGPEGGEMLPATEETKRKVKNWLDDLETAGESTPMTGLQRAFEAKPDTIVFISDGHFGDYDRVAARVKSLNKDAAVRVYAVGFFRDEKEDDSRSFVEFMKELAGRNRGEFRAVYADELKKRR